MSIIACNATISESRFVGNTITTTFGVGGAMSQLNSSVEVVSCTFERSTGVHGGAIAAHGSHNTLTLPIKIS